MSGYDYRQHLNVGNQTAENDTLLNDSFVAIRTSKFVGHGDHSIIVGRKGSGKSALRIHFFRANKDTENVLNIIPSPGDLVNTLSYVVENEKVGFSTEFMSVLWELTVYINLAGFCYKKDRPHEQPPEFSELDSTLANKIIEGGRYGLGRTLELISDHAPNIRVRGLLARSLRRYVRRVLKESGCNYYVLIDSIDDAVHNEIDTTQRNNLFASFFEGLLVFFHSFVNSEQNPISRQVLLHLFIPTDIYDWSVSRHADKLRSYKQIVYWNDHELNNFISSRLFRNLSSTQQARVSQLPKEKISQAIWSSFFPDDLSYESYYEGGVIEFKRPTWFILVNMTMRRPRDLQLIVQHIHSLTRDKGLSFPDDRTMRSALDRYSADMKQSVLAEYRLVLPTLEEILAQFSGNLPHMPKGLLLELLGRVVGQNKDQIFKAANILYDAGVIGGVRRKRNREADTVNFYDDSIYYSFSFPDFSIIWNYDTFAVHEAFWFALQIRSLRTGRLER